MPAITSPEHTQVMTEIIVGAIDRQLADSPQGITADRDVELDGETAKTEIRDESDGIVYELILRPVRRER